MTEAEARAAPLATSADAAPTAAGALSRSSGWVAYVVVNGRTVTRAATTMLMPTAKPNVMYSGNALREGLPPATGIGVTVAATGRMVGTLGRL